MAQTTTRRRHASSRNGRSASQKTEKYRFAQDVDGEGTAAEREYQLYAKNAREDPGPDPDVLLDVPVVKVDSIHFELDDLDAHVSLNAKVLDLVTLNVGIDAHLGKVKLDVKGVEAQALLKVRLDHVAAVVDRVFTTLDRNPELLKSIGRAVEDVGSGAGDTLDSAGDAVESVGEGAEGAAQDVGEGAGQAVGDIGEGAGQAVGEIGEGAGDAVEGVGEGVGQLAEGGAEQLAGELSQAAGGGPGQLAKVIARTVAREIGSAASDEAKDVSIAATRKVHELGDRRRQRRAEKHNATEAALKLADELDVDIDEVDGTGADGRITVKDVRDAQED